jgi:hypothetical protein
MNFKSIYEIKILISFIFDITYSIYIKIYKKIRDQLFLSFLRLFKYINIVKNFVSIYIILKNKMPFIFLIIIQIKKIQKKNKIYLFYLLKFDYV